MPTLPDNLPVSRTVNQISQIKAILSTTVS